MSKGGGDASYHQNSLNFDEHAAIQTGFAFTASDRLIGNFLYLWLPTIAIFIIGYFIYRAKKWVKEVNELKTKRI